jgi:hypothetical protein
MINQDAQVDLKRVVMRGARSRGAIFNTGALDIQDSTIGPANWGAGTAGGITNLGELTVEDTTIHNNFAVELTDITSGKGGGLLNLSGTADLNNVTLHRNGAEVDGDSIYRDSGTVALSNTVVSPSFGAFSSSNCGADSGKAFSSSGENFVVTDADNDCLTTSTSDQEGSEAGLDPLRNRGFFGPPSYFEPTAGGNLVDTGDPLLENDGGTCSPTDQRGVARPVDGAEVPAGAACDVGAVEFIDDTTPPEPKVNTQFAGGRKVTVKWKGTDEGSGIESFDIYVRSKPMSGGDFTQRKLIKENATVPGSMTITVKTDREYCVSAKALDRDGNESGFAHEACFGIDTH